MKCDNFRLFILLKYKQIMIVVIKYVETHMEEGLYLPCMTSGEEREDQQREVTGQI